MSKLNPLDKYGDLDQSNEWIELSWWTTSPENNKRVRLHNKLFGFRIKVKNKTYEYDGILMGWKEVHGRKRKVKIYDYLRLGQAHIVVPKELQAELEKILFDLRIDHRWHPYMPKNNLVVTYD